MRLIVLAWALGTILLPGRGAGERLSPPRVADASAREAVPATASPRRPLGPGRDTAPATASPLRPLGPGQDAAPATPPVQGASLRVFLLTIGRGGAVWERFGHNAIWIQDEASGQGAAYNWGIFDFDQLGFIPRLVRGTMLYSMRPYDPYHTLEDAQRADRRVWLQELALTPAQKWELLTFVQWNALPENRDYRYDYYRDNCSTRVRDALDRVLGGSIRAASEATSTSRSYRWHTRRLLRDVPLAYLGIQVVLGPRADRPLSAWEEMFLPTRLMEELRPIQVPDASGGLTPLVIQERMLRDSAGPPEPAGPPFALPWFLGVGMLWGGGLLESARRGRSGRLGWRLAAFAAGAGWALLASLAGLLLLGAWLFTDHTFWYPNLNLLQANPLALPLTVAFLSSLRRGGMPRWGTNLAAALAVGSALGALLALVPGVGQANGELLAFTLPVNLGLWAAARSAARGTTSAPPPGDGKEGVNPGGR